MKIVLSKKKIELVIYIFILLFSPPIIPRVSIIHFQFLYTMIRISLFYKCDFKEIMRIVELKRFFRGYFLWATIVLLSMIFGFITNPVDSSNYVLNLYKVFQAGIELPFCVIFVGMYCIHYNLSYEELLDCIIKAGLIQVVIGLAMALSPDVKRLLVSVMQQNNGSDIESILSWEYNRRYFAFSDCMLDMFGWGMGIIAILPLYLNSRKTVAIFETILLLMIGVMNSTTTIIIFIVMIGFVFLYKIKRINIKMLLTIIVGMGFFYIAYSWFKNHSEASYKWMVREITSIISGNKELSSFGHLMTKNKWYLPKSLGQLLFGSGHSVYGVGGFVHSDVGVINLIWLCGIVGVMIISIVFIKLLYNAGIKSGVNRYLCLGLVISFFLFELKGLGIGNNPGLVASYLVILPACIIKNQNLEFKNNIK